MPNANKQNKQRASKNKVKSLSKLGNKPVTNSQTVAHVAKQRTVTTHAPKVKTTREGMYVTHREYIQDVSRSVTSFVVDTIAINAGLASAFPWLSQVAGRFESYTFERLDFIFEPMVPTAQAGSVMMAVDFDANDSAPTNKTALMSYQGAVRSAPWQASRLTCSAIDRKKMVNERYVRSAALTGTYDIKTYDLGNLQLATVGTGATNVVLGELYVEYTVRLRTPQIQSGPSLALSRRTIQTGTFTLVPNGTISAHIANIVGDATQPLAMVLPQDPKVFAVNTFQRLLVTYWTKLAGTGAVMQVPNVATMLNLAQLNSVASLQNFDLFSSIRNRIGRPTNMYQQTAGPTVSAPTDVVESYIISPSEDSFVTGTTTSGDYGYAGTAFIGKPNTLVGTTPVTVNYTIIPLDNEIWPNSSSILGAQNVAITPIVWPNIDPISIIPAARLSIDDLNTFTFNRRDFIDEHPALKPNEKRR